MKRLAFLLPALALCLLLAACASTPPDPVSEGQMPPSREEENSPPEQEPADPAAAEALSLERLTVELVVDWKETDLLLAKLDTLSQLLREALAAEGCLADEVTVTVSTAGGFTGQALAAGGVDIAWLPGIDFLSCEDDAVPLLTAGQEETACVAAVTLAREELGDDFRQLLSRALLETEQGGEFLSLCPAADEGYRPFTQDAMEALWDWADSLEEAQG